MGKKNGRLIPRNDRGNERMGDSIQYRGDEASRAALPAHTKMEMEIMEISGYASPRHRMLMSYHRCSHNDLDHAPVVRVSTKVCFARCRKKHSLNLSHAASRKAQSFIYSYLIADATSARRMKHQLCACLIPDRSLYDQVDNAHLQQKDGASLCSLTAIAIFANFLLGPLLIARCAPFGETGVLRRPTPLTDLQLVWRVQGRQCLLAMHFPLEDISRTCNSLCKRRE